MKLMNQKLNKKHLSFIAACLCSAIFLNDNPSWGMDTDLENPKGIKRPATNNLAEEVQRPAKKQRMESKSYVNAWLTENFEKNPESFLKEDGIQKLVSFCVEKDLNFKEIRVGLQSFVQKQKAYFISAQKDLAFCNQCIDDTLDANPITAPSKYIEAKFTEGKYWVPDQTKTLLKNNLKDNLDKKAQGVQTIENLIFDIEPIYAFSQGILSVKGALIGMSDIDDYFLKMSQPQYGSLKEIHVFSPMLLIDADMECQGASFNFDVSQCLVLGNKTINLSGINGTNGAAGTKGGSFIGKANEFGHLNNLTIIINGGNGGNGIPGTNGKDADLNNLGNPFKTEGYHYIHESGAVNPPLACFQCFPKKMYWTTKGTRNFYEKPGEPGMPGSKGGLGGAGGLILLIKTTPYNEVMEETHGLDGAPGEDGAHGRPGRAARGVKLTNLELSYQLPIQAPVVGEQWDIGGATASGQQQLSDDIWEVAPHHVVDQTLGQ